MFRNYLKVAIRNIRRNKLYASLNILGLGVGLASFFVIYLFLQNEKSYDQFHTKKDRIYRVLETKTLGDETNASAGLNSELAPVAAEQIPEIEAFSRMENYGKSLVIPGRTDSVHYVSALTVEPGFMEFFDLDFIRGSANTSFQDPYDIVISASTETKLFDGDALGKTVKIRNKEFTIQGVYADIPHNSSLKAEAIVPYRTIYDYRLKRDPRWNVSYGNQTFFLLNEGASIEAVEAKLNEIRVSNEVLGTKEWTLQPLTEIHFSLGLVSDPIREKTDRQYVYIFTIVGFFILVCAVFNYISLALSQSIERTKEIGVRKVIGADKAQLFKQFISESVLFVLAGFIVALVLVEVMVPQLEELLGRQLSKGVSRTPVLLVVGLLFSLVVACLSALYPAYVSASQKVAGILKGQRRFSAHHLVNTISVFQIGVFMVLVSVAFTANRQMRFMQNENLGFDKENQLIIQTDNYGKVHSLEYLKNELAAIPGVASTGFSSSIPTRVTGSQRFSGHDFTFANFDVDEDYLSTMGIQLKAGRNFRPEDSDSSNLIIINEAAVANLDMEGTAVGRTMKAGKSEFRIIGVVNDFHWLSKREEVGATLFRKASNSWGFLAVKLETANLSNTMDQIRKVYEDAAGGEQMNFFFLDENVDAQYRQEKIMITMINSFAVIAAVVAFIGLFGIAGYSARRRLKEMGIRKVLGAGFMSIQLVLNRKNIIKILLAAAIAVPLIVYWMENWLSDFAYRIDLPVILILVALCVAAAIILLTAMFHSVKAFFINPVEILKDE